MKIMLSLASVAALALTSAPAAAQHHGTNHGRHHATRHVRHFAPGHRFARNYRYTSYRALPRVYVTRYHLSPRYRYVYTDGYIYVVDPVTFAITRILNAF